MYYYDIINLCLFNLGVTAVLRNIRIFCNSDNSVYFVYDDGVCGIEISSLPIYVWHLSILYRYVDILSGDRMIVGISISVRLATGFGGFMPSHSLAPVMIPQIWVVTVQVPFLMLYLSSSLFSLSLFFFFFWFLP